MSKGTAMEDAIPLKRDERRHSIAFNAHERENRHPFHNIAHYYSIYSVRHLLMQHFNSSPCETQPAPLNRATLRGLRLET